MSKEMPKAFYELLHELQTVDFVLVELTLYLDTHPEDGTALKQFSQFQRRKMVLMEQVEKTYGPLQQFGGSPVGATWAWAEAPWPWQL